MTNLTLIYYSAHSLPIQTEAKMRKELLKVVKGKYPIISVTQKPVDLGDNICVGEIGRSHYNCFKQILIGAIAAKTTYVAMVEDDTLYNIEHFAYRPSGETFAYNKSMWFLENTKDGAYFWHKYSTGMFGCIAPRHLLIDTLEERFMKFPVEPLPRKKQRHYWQEPGRDERLGLINRKIEYFETHIPLITINYFNGLNGKKKSTNNDPIVSNKIPYFGEASYLKQQLW